ncbi:hypothetical protein [Mycolicibacterium duvalii]|uniref:hypothetical protein n=1 Tax=Mycolicibacterium duvalii TaxID=39688 RepID=UPI0021F34CFC|nr:hypothetical protein [Mycolicibacterium duvalii]
MSGVAVREAVSAVRAAVDALAACDLDLLTRPDGRRFRRYAPPWTRSPPAIWTC